MFINIKLLLKLLLMSLIGGGIGLASILLAKRLGRRRKKSGFSDQLHEFSIVSSFFTILGTFVVGKLLFRVTLDKVLGEDQGDAGVWADFAGRGRRGDFDVCANAIWRIEPAGYVGGGGPGARGDCRAHVVLDRRGVAWD